MILERYLNNDINNSLESTQYFGEDIEKFEAAEAAEAAEDAKKYIIDNIYKECITWGGDKGFIIGIEKNHIYSDYYFIVYIPDKELIVYELVNAATIL